MTTSQLRRIVALVSAIAVVSVAIALATLTWRLTGQDDGRTRAAIALSAPRQVAGASSALAGLLRAAPFGASTTVSAATANATGLILRGIVWAIPRSSSTALISASGGPVVTVAVGQTAPGGGVVESIEIDRVVLNVGGERQALTFHDTPVAPSTPAPPPTMATPPVVAAPTTPTSVPPTPGQATAPATAPAGVTSPPSVVELYRQRLNQNPQAAVQSLGAQATPEGYRIGPTPAPELLRAGLQAGDVIASVNGVRVGDGQSDRTLFDQAVVAGNARVEIVRNGQRMVLSFPLR